jgi:hypothetical protein
MGSIRGSSYYAIVDGPTWSQAEANSVALGGHLVTINDSGENDFIKSTVRNEIISQYGVSGEKTARGEWINHPFTGLRDQQRSGTWSWSSGEGSTFRNWYPGEPGGGGEYFGTIYLIGDTSTYNALGYWNNSAEGGQIGIAEIPLSYFSVSDLTLTEGSSGTVTITRTGGTRSTQNLTLTSSNGTASAGSDHTSVSTTVSFAAGETSKTVSISTIDDSSVESSETFNLALTASSADAVPAQISDGTALITIADNDTATTKSTFSINSTNAWEGDTASVVITRSGGLSNVINLNVNTANGTAKEGSDYTSLNSTITFLAGETTKTISIATKEDSAKESDETFTVSISSSDSLAQFSTSSGTVTIEDDDAEKGNTTNTNTNGNNNTVVTGDRNTVNNTTVINNTTNTVNNNTTNNIDNSTTTTTNNTTNNTNNIANNFSNIVGNITVDLSSLIQGVSSKSDAISGSAKDDVLGAGKGADKLTGASGADQFVFNTKDSFGNAGADTITDFNPEEGDQLILSPDALPGLTTDPSLQSVTSKKALKAAQKSEAALIYYQPLGQLFYDQNGSGKGFGSGGLFAVLSGAPVLTAENLGVF